MNIFKNTLILVICSLLISAGSRTEQGSELNGSWTLIKYKYGTEKELSEVPEIITYVKHLTDTHFSWASYGENGNLVAGGGGTYEIVKDVYTEHIDYFFPRGSNLPGSSVSFKYQTHGNDWTISGFVKNIQINPASGKYESIDSVRLEEVWRRL
jgi:hypothetical protein